MIDPSAVYVAIIVSTMSVGIWMVLALRMVWFVAHGHERRPFILAMPAVGLLAAVGTLASAVGFGISSGIIHLDIPQALLTMVASMGRGGLLMGGVIALAYYRPIHPK